MNVGAVASQVANDVRRRWKSSLGLALLIGLVAATLFATIAGARRTETAYDRYLAEADAEDVSISFYGTGGPLYESLLADMRAIPQVETISETAPMIAVPEVVPELMQDSQAGLDDQYLYKVNKPRLVEGRLPGSDRADEVLLNVAAAESLGFGVGDTIRLRTASRSDYEAAPTLLTERGLLRSFTVTGIAVFPGEVVPMAPVDGGAGVIFSPAYYAAHPDETFDYSYLHIRLKGGAADVAMFRTELSHLLEQTGIPVQYVPFIDAGARQAKVNRAIRPQAEALLIFGGMLGLVGLLILGRLLARHLLLDEDDRRQLWSLGFTRSQLLLVAMLRVLIMLAVAISLAMVGAILISGRFPIGPARTAERHPGIAVNVAVLALGTLVLSAVILIGAGVSVFRSLPRLRFSSSGPAPIAASRPSRVAAAIAELGAPPTAVVGVRMALERGRGRTAVPVVGALIATALALASLMAAFTFGTNLERLVTTPALYGLKWDIAIGNGFGGLPHAKAKAILDGDSDIAAWSAANIGELRLRADGVTESLEISTPAIGIDTFGSDVYPRMISGRPVRHEDEIVLGRRTANSLGVDIGDFVVTNTQAGDPVTLEIVGFAVFPGVGRAIFDSTDLDEGATVMAALLEDFTITGGLYTTYFVRYRDGLDQGPANQRLRDAFRDLDPDCQFELCIVTDQTPGGIRNYNEVKSTPVVLAGVFALLALATLATTLATSVRRRRRDHAVLKALGFVRRQVAIATAWQATTVATIALVVGVPFGVVGGRALWSRFSQSIGVEVSPQTPTVAILIAIPLTIVLANAIAFIPGRLAARANTAYALRSE